MADDPLGDDLLRPRWRGQRGRVEVWYATLTDAASDTGFWVHAETVAPDHAEPYAHGWAAAFPGDSAPVVERFGPVPFEPASDGFAAGGVTARPAQLAGNAGEMRWDLRVSDESAPLFTFPRWAWEREVLPAAQVVAQPSAVFDGQFAAPGRTWQLRQARGAVARIYGHGNAERWAWLHADLGGSDCLEIVSAVSRRPGLRLLPPLSFVALRVDGQVWPPRPELAAPLFRTRLGLPDWSVSGIVGRRRLRVRVQQPPQAQVELRYTDPDGATAVCANTERASAVVRLDRWAGGWRKERRWRLDGRAHAEVGLRPVPDAPAPATAR